MLPWRVLLGALAALAAMARSCRAGTLREIPAADERQKPLPVYALLAESGDDHAKSFQVSCTLSQPPLAADGVGNSRRAAEQAAAEAVLDHLQER